MSEIACMPVAWLSFQSIKIGLLTLRRVWHTPYSIRKSRRYKFYSDKLFYNASLGFKPLHYFIENNLLYADIYALKKVYKCQK